MPNFGAGSGRMAKEVLGAYDAGTDWVEQQAVRKRQAAIDTENLRGAQLRNNEQEKATGRTDDMHPMLLEQQSLINRFKSGAITKQEYDTESVAILNRNRTAEEKRTAEKEPLVVEGLRLGNEQAESTIGLTRAQTGGVYSRTALTKVQTDAAKQGISSARRDDIIKQLKLDSELKSADLKNQRAAQEITALQYENMESKRKEELARTLAELSTTAEGVKLGARIAEDTTTIKTAGGIQDATNAQNGAITATTDGAIAAKNAQNGAIAATAYSGASADISENELRGQEAEIQQRVNADVETTRNSEKDTRDRIAALQLIVDESEAEQNVLDDAWKVRGKDQSNKADYQASSDAIGQKAVIGIMAQHSYDPKGTPKRLNDNEALDIDGVVRVDTINGVFRAYDADNNLVMETSGSEPSPVEWDLSALNTQMIEDHFPAEGRRLAEELKHINKVEQDRSSAAAVDPRKAVDALNGLTKEVQSMAKRYVKTHYDKEMYSDGSLDFSPEQLREFETLTSSVMQYNAGKVPVAQSWENEQQFPVLKEQLNTLGIKTDTAFYKELDAVVRDRNARGGDVTRMSMMEGLLKKYQDQSVTQGGAPPGRISSSSSPTVQQIP